MSSSGLREWVAVSLFPFLRRGLGFAHSSPDTTAQQPSFDSTLVIGVLLALNSVSVVRLFYHWPKFGDVMFSLSDPALDRTDPQRVPHTASLETLCIAITCFWVSPSLLLITVWLLTLLLFLGKEMRNYFHYFSTYCTDQLGHQKQLDFHFFFFFHPSSLTLFLFTLVSSPLLLSCPFPSHR